jgi:hypothetical protein
MFSDYHWIIMRERTARSAFLEVLKVNLFENCNRYIIMNPNEPIRFEDIEEQFKKPIHFRTTRTLNCFALQDSNYFFFIKKSDLKSVDALFLKSIGYLLHEGRDLTAKQLDKVITTAQRLRAEVEREKTSNQIDC